MKAKQKGKTEEGKIVSIVCRKCKRNFGVNSEYIGVITCPYCGEYVEG